MVLASSFTTFLGRNCVVRSKELSYVDSHKPLPFILASTVQERRER